MEKFGELCEDSVGIVDRRGTSDYWLKNEENLKLLEKGCPFFANHVK